MDAMPAAPDDEARRAPAHETDAATAEAVPHDAAQLPAQPAVAFSVYRYGFRFLSEELDVLQDIFARNGGATPSHENLRRIAAAMSASPARLAEPPHPVQEKQIKTWFENRRQKLRRERDRAAGRSSAGCKRSRSKEQLDAEEQAQDGIAGDEDEDASVMAAAKALLEASASAPTPRAEHQEAPAQLAALTPVRGVPIPALAAPAEASCAGDGGIGALLLAIRDEVERSTLSAHTKELLLLHLLHSWSVLRTASAPLSAALGQQRE